MEEKEKLVDYSTIRIKNTIRKELDSLKVESESYSVVINNLLAENKRLHKDNNLLSDVLANISTSKFNVKLYAEVISVIISGSSEDENKLQDLINYFSDKIEVEAIEVLEAIGKAKAVVNDESVLNSFESYVNDKFS